jgi:hypothetical protein
MDPRIVDYIRANRRRYTREAITKQLEDAGHARAEIDAAWEALHVRDPDQVVGEAFWPRFWLYLIGLNLAALLLVGLLSGMLTSGILVPLVILGVVLAIGAAITLAIVAATHPTEMGRGTAIAVGGLVPLLFTFLIAGSCYALIGAIGGGGPPSIAGTMELTIEPPRQFEGGGAAICQLPPAGVVGFSVFGQELGTLDGRSLFVAIDSFGAVDGAEDGPAPAPPAGGEQPTNLNVSLAPRSETDQPDDYHTGPGTELDIDVSPDGLRGSIRFENLTPSLPGIDPISGTVAWECG